MSIYKLKFVKKCDTIIQKLWEVIKIQNIDAEILKNNIEKIAEYDLTENNVFGSSYIVCQNGKTVYKNHFGFSDTEGKVSTNDKTMFRLASMTKPVTAFAVLILIDRGMLTLDDEVKKHLPEFEDIHIITPEGADLGLPKNPPTIKHLLTHTSGFGGTKVVKMDDVHKKSILNTVNCFAKAGLDFEPYSQEAYSAFAAHDALALIVERLTGKDFAEFLKEEIFAPCGMTDTTFIPTQEQWSHMMTMHNKQDGKNCVGETEEGCVFESFPATHKLAGAGLASTLDDYSRFAEMLLNKGKGLVSEKTFRLINQPHAPFKIMYGHEQWGLSVRVVTDEEYKYMPIGSYGWSGAYGSHFWVDPVNNITAVFMKNSRFDGGAGNMSAQRFERAVYYALKKQEVIL